MDYTNKIIYLNIEVWYKINNLIINFSWIWTFEDFLKGVCITKINFNMARQ